jgi:hypothetical protein
MRIFWIKRNVVLHWKHIKKREAFPRVLVWIIEAAQNMQFSDTNGWRELVIRKGKQGSPLVVNFQTNVNVSTQCVYDHLIRR